jgi:hypothetical protein
MSWNRRGRTDDSITPWGAVQIFHLGKTDPRFKQKGKINTVLRTYLLG